MATEHQDSRDWLTSGEVAKIISRSVRTVRRWATRDRWRSRLDTVSDGRTVTRLYHRDDILASYRESGGVLAERVAGGLSRVSVLETRQLEVFQAAAERMADMMPGNTAALNRLSAAMERRDLRRTWSEALAEATPLLLLLIAVAAIVAVSLALLLP